MSSSHIRVTFVPDPGSVYANRTVISELHFFLTSFPGRAPFLCLPPLFYSPFLTRYHFKGVLHTHTFSLGEHNLGLLISNTIVFNLFIGTCIMRMLKSKRWNRQEERVK
jgi:hypothetical protein